MCSTEREQAFSRSEKSTSMRAACLPRTFDEIDALPTGQMGACRMVNTNASWLRQSIAEPVLKAKAQISNASATDLVVSADVFQKIANALSDIGRAADNGFLKTELDNSFFIAELGATIASLQVWKSGTVAPNTVEIWAATHRSMEGRPTMHAGKVQITVN
jgi:hypothetical protein